MSDDSRSMEEILSEIDRQAAALPPGSDVASFIAEKHRELGELLARRVAGKRAAASQEAGFSPSGMPPLRPSGDEAGQDSTPEDGGSPPG